MLISIIDENSCKGIYGIKNMKNVEIIRKGAYSKSTVLNFRNIAEGSSPYIDEIGNSTIETITI